MNFRENGTQEMIIAGHSATSIKIYKMSIQHKYSFLDKNMKKQYFINQLY